MAVLQPLMAQARDVGLHVVVARRTGGASRALYEPVIQSLRDLAMPGVMLSGPRDEGVLIGNLRPQPAPGGSGPCRHPRRRHRDHAAGLARPDDVDRSPASGGEATFRAANAGGTPPERRLSGGRT